MKRAICMPSTNSKWPSTASRMRARRMARSASLWLRMPVSSRASVVTRSAANCMISTASMPPSDRPARANLPAGIWSTTQRAALSQLSQIASGARRQSGTTISASPESAATWSAYSRGEQSMPGSRSSAVLFIGSSRRERSLGAAAGIPMAGHGRRRFARHRLRSRHPARPVPRAGAVVHLHRSHPDQHRELADRAQLRLQRRHGNLRLHLGLHRGDRLCPHDGARGLGARRRPHLPPRLAALRRAHPLVRRLLGPGRLGVDRPRHAGADRGDGAARPGPESLSGHPRGRAAEVPPGQSRRVAALHRPAGVLPLRAAGRRPLAVLYLLFSAIIALSWHYNSLEQLIPAWVARQIYPIDKTNIDILRFLHFLAIAWLVRLAVPAKAPFLRWRIFEPLRRCGEHSLQIFCLGIFLALTAQVVVAQNEDSIVSQIGMSVAGLLIMSVAAYGAAWYKRGPAIEDAA